MIAMPGAAEVKLSVNADGTLLVHNDGGSSPRSSSRSGLISIPEDRWDGLIHVYSQRQSLDPKLVRAIIQVESAFDDRAVSRKGAMGLMQLMPGTARDLSVADPFDPEHNIRGGTRYLRRLLDAFEEDLTLALAAYNAGPDAVRRWGDIPPYRETRDYVRKVLKLYRGVVPTLPPPPKTQRTSGDEYRRGRPVRIQRGPGDRLLITTGK